MDDKLKVLLTRALGTANFSSVTEVRTDWMQANQIRPFFDADPALIWLNYYGALEGFYADDPPYNLASFLAAKKRQFREKWVAEMATGAPSVCQAKYDLYQADSLLATCQLMLKGVPAIVLPSLWYAGEKVFGKPDLIVRTTWLRDQLASGRLALADPAAKLAGTGGAGARPGPGRRRRPLRHRSTWSSPPTWRKLAQRPRDQANVAQARIQAYILGQLQGYMPPAAYFIGRTAPSALTPVAIGSTLGAPLDPDLAGLRDQFIEIKVNGARYRPWRDALVANNPKNTDERWARAKAAIARHPDSGGDLRLLPNVGVEQQAALASRGIPNLRTLLAIETAELSQQLTGIQEIGAKRRSQLCAILLANRTQLPVLPPPGQLSPTREFEFYVDFEFFSNLNVDCGREVACVDGPRAGLYDRDRLAGKRCVACPAQALAG